MNKNARRFTASAECKAVCFPLSKQPPTSILSPDNRALARHVWSHIRHSHIDHKSTHNKRPFHPSTQCRCRCISVPVPVWPPPHRSSAPTNKVATDVTSKAHLHSPQCWRSRNSRHHYASRTLDRRRTPDTTLHSKRQSPCPALPLAQRPNHTVCQQSWRRAHVNP
jgi:hypothetical protein